MNTTIISGNIGQDAQIKPHGDQVVINFSVAVTKKWKSGDEQKEKTTWFSCSLWRKAEHTRIADFLKKGQKVICTGEIEADAYLKNGEPVATLRLRCDVVEFSGSNTTPASEPTPQAIKTASGEELDRLVRGLTTCRFKEK